MQIRQGDVLIESGTIPGGVTRIKAKRGRLILAEGEATGHHHSVAEQDAQMFERDGTLYLRVQTDTEVEHQEHAAIGLPAGDYRVTRQREYTPEAIRNVAD